MQCRKALHANNRRWQQHARSSWMAESEERISGGGLGGSGGGGGGGRGRGGYLIFILIVPRTSSGMLLKAVRVRVGRLPVVAGLGIRSLLLQSTRGLTAGGREERGARKGWETGSEGEGERGEITGRVPMGWRPGRDGGREDGEWDRGGSGRNTERRSAVSENGGRDERESYTV